MPWISHAISENIPSQGTAEVMCFSMLPTQSARVYVYCGAQLLKAANRLEPILYNKYPP